MHKSDFVAYIAAQNNCSKKEANEIVDIFTSSTINVLGSGEDVSLVGFGNFTVSHVPSRAGINPRTKEAIQIKAYNQPKFKVGQKFKELCNK